MKSAVIIFILFLTGIDVKSQSDPGIGKESHYQYKNELGINFTNVLGNVLSLNPNNTNSAYNISYRRHGNNGSLRSALNFFFEESDDFDLSGNQKLLTVSNTQISVGIQKTLLLSHGLAMGYGCDVIGAFEYENSQVINLNGTSFDATDKLWRVGMGPILRLEYKLSQRVFFSTESSFYAIYGKKNSQIRESGFPLAKNTSDQWEVRLLLPQSLFINIAF